MHVWSDAYQPSRCFFRRLVSALVYHQCTQVFQLVPIFTMISPIERFDLRKYMPEIRLMCSSISKFDWIETYIPSWIVLKDRSGAPSHKRTVSRLKNAGDRRGRREYLKSLWNAYSASQRYVLIRQVLQWDYLTFI